jgi:N-acetylneuraminate synthase
LVFQTVPPKQNCIAATALGAKILEFHVVFDRQMFIDSKASLTILKVKELVCSVKNISSAPSIIL